MAPTDSDPDLQLVLIDLKDELEPRNSKLLGCVWASKLMQNLGRESLPEAIEVFHHPIICNLWGNLSRERLYMSVCMA